MRTKAHGWTPDAALAELVATIPDPNDRTREKLRVALAFIRRNGLDSRFAGYVLAAGQRQIEENAKRNAK